MDFTFQYKKSPDHSVDQFRIDPPSTIALYSDPIDNAGHGPNPVFTSDIDSYEIAFA